MRLHTDKNLLIQEFKSKLMAEVENSRHQLENDIKTKFGSVTPMGKIELDTYVETVNKKIRIYIDGNAITLFNNYGSGSLMDVNNNALINEYIGFEKGSNWNPHRSVSDTTIRGRPEGEYIDIFGKKRKSKGNREGEPLEGEVIRTKSGYELRIEPREPSHAIEYGISWFVVQLPDLVERAIHNMDFAKCLTYR